MTPTRPKFLRFLPFVLALLVPVPLGADPVDFNLGTGGEATESRPVQAEVGSRGASDNVEVALLSDVASIQPGKQFLVALHMKLDPGWHTYWKNPGDSGLPLKIQWELPPGFTPGEIQWPIPSRVPEPPLMGYGYHGEVLFTVPIMPPKTLEVREVRIAGTFDWLECKDICIPGGSKLAITLPVEGTSRLGPAAGMIAAGQRALPTTALGWEVSARAGDEIVLTAQPPQGITLSALEFFPNEGLVIESAALQRLESSEGSHRLTMTPDPNAEGKPSRLAGVLIYTSGDARHGVVIDVPVAGSASAGGTTGAAGPAGWPIALAFAFLGGMILNLMPCVLPVLSLKVLGIVEHSGEEPGRAWRHGLVYALGVLATFWILAAVLLALRAAGQHVGWGFQLQSAPFLAFLSGLFLILALNLFGMFEIGASLTRAGGHAGKTAGLTGSFGSGVLATIAATPCTAPFMGSALGFALGQPAAMTLLVFTALGLGMALPYVVLTTSPVLLRFVPRPGPWMKTMKQVMGFLLLAVVVALVWLFGHVTGIDGAGFLLAALLLLGAGAWAYGHAQTSRAGSRARGLSYASAAVLLLAGLGLGIHGTRTLASSTSTTANAGESGVWEPYSATRVEALRAEGKPMFIDFTAAWCLTCQVNERVALANAEVAKRFRDEGVALLKADWTRRDDEITQALAGYGRQGVPVYILYGRDRGSAPRFLPELLTPAIVLSALDETLGPDGAAESVSFTSEHATGGTE
ncbi:MAG TPA: thioredoxin family protein [Candidatus Eisenbacteria bacterium]|nr:thioredoxin family protein [Candidatus Eisenbacteria bacterium]